MYTKKSPEVLVQQILSCASEGSEALTYEEAKPLSAIKEYVVREIYAVPEWRNHLENNSMLSNICLIGTLQGFFQKYIEFQTRLVKHQKKTKNIFSSYIQCITLALRVNKMR